MGYLFTKAKKSKKNSRGGAEARGALREEFLTTNHTNLTNRRSPNGGVLKWFVPYLVHEDD